MSGFRFAIVMVYVVFTAVQICAAQPENQLRRLTAVSRS